MGRYLLPTLALIFPLTSAQELHTFSNGEVADEKINENFEHLNELIAKFGEVNLSSCETHEIVGSWGITSLTSEDETPVNWTAYFLVQIGRSQRNLIRVGLGTLGLGLVGVVT